MKIIERLRTVRPEYTLMLPSWHLYRDAYSGKGGFSTGQYLWSGLRENTAIYDKRRKAATYLNLFRPAVDKFTGWLFKGNPVYENASELFLQWVKDVKLFYHLKKATKIALTYGNSPIFLDADESGQIYIVVYNPMALTDWNEQVDASGENTGFYNGSKVAITSINSDILSGEHEQVEDVYIWTPEIKQHWQIVDNKAIELVNDANPYGIAPLVNLDFTIGSDDTTQVPLFDSLAGLCTRIYNWMSEQWAYTQKGLLNPIITVQEGEVDAKSDYNPDHNVISYQPGMNSPAMLSGDARPFAEYREQITGDIENAAYVSGQRGPTSYIYPQSGEAYKQQAVDTVAILDDLGEELEKTMYRIAKLWEAMTGNDAGDIHAEWPDPIVESDTFTLDDLTNLESTAAFDSIPSFRNAVMREQAKIISRGNRETLTQIQQEIERLPVDASDLPITGTGATPIENESGD